MLREIISRCKTIKYCADNFTQDFGLDLELIMLYCDIKFLTRIIYADIGIIYATC